MSALLLTLLGGMTGWVVGNTNLETDDWELWFLFMTPSLGFLIGRFA